MIIAASGLLVAAVAALALWVMFKGVLAVVDPVQAASADHAEVERSA